MPSISMIWTNTHGAARALMRAVVGAGSIESIVTPAYSSVRSPDTSR